MRRSYHVIVHMTISWSAVYKLLILEQLQYYYTIQQHNTTAQQNKNVNQIVFPFFVGFFQFFFCFFGFFFTASLVFFVVLVFGFCGEKKSLLGIFNIWI